MMAVGGVGVPVVNAFSGGSYVCMEKRSVRMYKLQTSTLWRVLAVRKGLRM